MRSSAVLIATTSAGDESRQSRVLEKDPRRRHSVHPPPPFFSLSLSSSVIDGWLGSDFCELGPGSTPSLSLSSLSSPSPLEEEEEEEKKR